MVGSSNEISRETCVDTRRVFMLPEPKIPPRRSQNPHSSEEAGQYKPVERRGVGK